MRHTSLAALLSAALLVVTTIIGTRQILAAASPESVTENVLAAHVLHDDMASHVMASTACSPRPQITVSTVVEAGRLRVQVGATTSTALLSNTLQSLRFGTPTNAQVRLADQTSLMSSREVQPSSPSRTYVFYVERTAEGIATVPLTVVDACGDWSTFVGGGPSVLALMPTVPATPVPPTGTIPPTATPVPPTSTPGAVAMYEGVPVCTDHDSVKWHPLVKRDGSGAVTCTYGHEHHADPNSVNDIFGRPSAWYGGSQEISYPWQTSSNAGQENHVKHEGYKWYVERDQPCRPVWPAPNDGCIVAWRVQIHQLGTAADATVRFHSYSMEALVEYHGRRGVVHHGGWIDGGHLALNVEWDPLESTCRHASLSIL